MSGGAFNYYQYHINTIIDDIESVIHKNKKPISYEELSNWEKNNYDVNNPPLYSEYSDKTIEEFKKGVNILKQAVVYAQRIDWLLSGDDGEETFHERLKEDLSKID